MKTQPTNRILTVLLGTIAILSLPAASQAAPVAFGAPTTIAGDTDVATSGTLLYAYDWANAAETVNTVPFTGTVTTTSVGSLTMSGWTGGNNTTAFTSTTAPFSGLSTAYKGMLVGADYTSAATAATITLGGLTVGNKYLVQYWVNDPRGAGTARTETVNSLGNTVTLSYPYSVAGQPGQYTIGTFTADATSQVITISGNASTQINALQVRTLTLTTYYWDPSGSSGIGGAGTWNTNAASTYWSASSSGGSGVVWPNASGFTTLADFAGATAGTVTIPTATTNNVNSITFGTTGYTIAGATATAALNASGLGALTVTTGAGDSETIGAVIVGTAGLAKANDTGTLTLSGVNTYTGETVISGGTLTIGSAGQLGSGNYAGAITNNGTFTYSSSAGQTLTSLISGTGALTMSGSGTLVLADNNTSTYSGVTTITSGTLQLGASGLYGRVGSASTSIVVNSGGTLAFYQGETCGQTISGAGNVTTLSSIGSGYQETLTAANSYTGTTTVNGVGINAPILAMGGVNSSIGASANAAANLVIVGSGLLAYTGTTPVNTDRLLTIGTTSAGGTGTIANNAAATANSLAFTNIGAIAYGTTAQTRTVVLAGSNVGTNIFAPVIGNNGSGVVSFTKSGAGNWALTGANTYTGATTISGGTLLVDGSLASGSAVTVASGTVLGGTGTVNGTVNAALGAQLAPGDPAISGGIGTLTLANNSATSLTLNGSVLKSALSTTAGTCSAVAISGGSGTLVLNGANFITLTTPLGGAPAGTYTLMTYAAQTGSGTLALDRTYPNASLSVGATSVTLTVTGAGLSFLEWAGDGSANQWNITATGDWLSGGVAATYADGQMVTFDDSSANNTVTITPNAVAPASVVVNTSAKSYTISGWGIGGTASLAKFGSAALNLSSTNTFSGGTTLAAGSTILKAGTGTLGIGAVNFAGGGLGFNPGSTGNAYTYTNSLAANANGTMAADDGVTHVSGPLALASGVTLTAGTAGWSGKNLFLDGLIYGAGALMVQPQGLTLDAYSTSTAGEVFMTASNSYSGGTTLSGFGTLKLINTNALGTGPLTIATTNTTLDLSALTNGATLGNNLVLPAPTAVGNVTIYTAGGAGNLVNLPGNISGGNSKITLYLNTATADGTAGIGLSGNNTYSGTTLINRGALTLNSPSALGFSTLNDDSYAGTLAFGFTGTLTNALQITYTGQTFNVGANAVTLSGPQSFGSFNMTMLGSGSLTLSSSANTGTGAMTIGVGTLALTGSAPLASSSISIVPGDLFDVSGLSSTYALGAAQTLIAGDPVTPVTDINGNFSSGGTINIAGTGTNGTLTIAGNLSLTGGTLVYDLGTSSDSIALAGASPTLSLSGTTTILPTAIPVGAGTYNLINNISSIASGTAANLALAGGAARGATPTFNVSAPTVTLNIGNSSGPATLYWQGTSGPNWDLSTINWLNGSSPGGTPDQFYPLDNVIFDDTGLAPVSLVGLLAPATVTINTAAINNVFSGSGSIVAGASLTLNGTSTTTMGTANSFTGGTTINSGTLQLANGSALGNGTGPLTLNGGVLDLYSNNLSVQTLSGTGGIITNTFVTATANTKTLTVYQMPSNSFAGSLRKSTGTTTNDIALVQNGPGYLLLSSTANTLTGGATVNAGTLEMASAGTMGYTVAQGATLKMAYTIGATYGNSVVVNGSGAGSTNGLYLKGGVSDVFEATSGSTGVILTNAPSTIRTYGSGNATLNGYDINYTMLTVNANASGSVSAPTVNIACSSYGYRMNVISGANTASGDLLIGGVVSGTGSVTWSNQAVNLEKYGTGSVLLTNVNTSTGYGVAAGTLMLGSGNNRLPVTAGVVLGNGGTSGDLQLNGVGQTLANLVVDATVAGCAVVGGSTAGSTLTINNAGADIYPGAIGGTGANQNNLSLVKTGAGLLTLSGPLTYTGSTTISAGTVMASGLTNADGTTLTVPDVAGTLCATNLALGTSAGCTVAITSFAGASSAPIVVTNLSTQGAVTINLSGTLTAGVAYPLIKYTSGAIGGAGFSAFQLERGISGVVSNDVANSSVDVLLSGTSIYPLAWKGNVNTNWDVATTNWAFGFQPNTFHNSDNVQFDDTAVSTSTNVVLNATVSPSTLTVTNNALNYIISGNGAIAGSFGLTKYGSASLTLLTTNTYTGPNLINGGTVAFATIANGGLASPLGEASNNSTNIVLNGGTLAYIGQTNSTDHGITLTTNGATISVTQPNGSLTLAGPANFITGAGALTKNGNGTLIISPITSGGYSMNNYTGGTVVNAGKLVCTVWDWATGRGVGSGQLTVNNGAYVEFTQVHGFGQDNNGKSAVLSGGTLQLDNGNYASGFTFAGGLVNGAGLTVSSSGLPITANAAATTAVISNNIVGTSYSGASGIPLSVSNGAAPIGLEMAGNLSDSGFACNITKNGAGAALLAGTNTYSGNTTINAGDLIMANYAFSPNTPTITVASNATLDVSGLTVPMALGSSQTLQGSGTVVGAVSDSSGTTIIPGSLTNAGTLAISGDLTLAGSETLDYSLGKTPTSAGGTNNSQITVAGNLTINSGTTVNVNPIQIALAGGTYKLISYTGALTDNTGGAIATAWTVNGYPTPAGRVTGIALSSATPGEIDLIVTGSPANLVWQGDGSANVWDVQNTANWLNGATLDQFYQFDNVLFNDLGSNNVPVDLQADITASSVVVSNNVENYTFTTTTSSPGLDGPGTLTKNGTGTLTIWNSNPLTGVTTINGGTLALGDGASVDGALTASPIVDNATLEFNVASSQSAAASISGSGTVVQTGYQFGTLTLNAANSWTGGLNVLAGTTTLGVNYALPGAESVTVANNAQFDFNGIANGSTSTRAYSFTIAGAGPDSSSGALVNNSSTSIAANSSVSNLTLSADATIGGNGRWDIGFVTNSTLNGNAHVLTKAGPNTIDVRAQTITNVANIQITSGNLYYETYSQTNPWTATMTNVVASGAILGIYGSYTVNVPIVSQGGTIENEGSGVPVFSGPVDVEQPSTLSSANGSVVFSGTVSNGPSGAITLTGNNTVAFAGTDLVPVADMSWSTGTVQLGNLTPSGSVPDAVITVPSGGTFSVNRSDLYTLTNTIAGAGNMSVLGTNINGLVVNGSASINIGGNLSVGQGAYGRLLIQPGASITNNAFYVGNPNAAGGGDVIQTGGSMTVTNLTTDDFRIGHWATETSSYSMFGGYLNVARTLSVGWDGTGSLRQTNGTINVGLELEVPESGHAGPGTFALEGGSIIIGGSGIYQGSGTFYLGGGTVGASTNWSTSAAMTLTGTNGSTIFDTSVYTNTLGGVLSGPGGLVKNSAGTLILSSSSQYTYAGDTVINGGNLTLNGSAVGSGVNKLSSGTVWVNPGATLNLAAAAQFNYGAGTPNVVLNDSTLAMTDGQYNYIKTITLTNGATWALGTGSTINGLTGANFGLSTVTSQASANTSFITSRSGAIAATGGVTFNVARGTASPDLLVSATLADYNGSLGSITKTGSGILALNGYNIYTGTTTVSAGTLAVGAAGSLASTNIVIAGGATLDVSATTFALAGNQTLGNSGTGTAALNGSVNASAGKLTLAYASGTPSLSVANGTLQLAATSNLKVNNTGAALAAGSYKLVSNAGLGSVAGPLPPSVSVGGNGVAAGSTNSLQITSGELYLVVTPTVNLNPTNLLTSVSGNQLTFSWPSDHTGWFLQAQTNSLATGLSATGWVNVIGSDSTNSLTVTMDPTKPTVFYRMWHN